MMNALYLKADGTKKRVNIKSFCEGRSLVNSILYNSSAELVFLNNGKVIMIDEEGKLKDLPRNEVATELAQDDEAIFPSDYIVGDVVIFDDVDNFDGLPYEI